METHFSIAVKLFFYILARYQLGYKLTSQQKYTLIKFLYSLFTDFFSKYIPNDSELGKTGLEISARDNLCLPSKPEHADQEEIHEIFQESSVCTPVSCV
jgi:hypothetical protein